jgi:integrase
MGTIVARKRKDGTTGYTAQILRKKGGQIVWREAKTFDRQREAKAWLAYREAELGRPGAIEAEKEKAKGDKPTLAAAIDQYVKEHKAMGRTKAQVLRTLKGMPIAQQACEEIASTDLAALATELGQTRKPQTVGNYMSHLQAVFAVAEDEWGFPLDIAAMNKAMRSARKLGKVAKSAERDRRPTLDELDRLMTHFQEVWYRRPTSCPMHRVVAFALFSTRRQEEITTIRRADYERDRMLVRNMKHPGQKVGNDVWVDLPAPAPAVVDAMGTGDRLFPYTTDAISAAFTRACHFLEIEDLHFHDLRHEGISRLFEMGWTIPQVAQVSGHRSWTSLKRYTQMRKSGDKYEGWKWLPIVTAPKKS